MKPNYADYIVFGPFQWARVVSPFKLLEDEDPVYAWRKGCSTLSTAWRANRRAIRCKRPRHDGGCYGCGLSQTSAAAFRKQSRHRQSSPSSGIGSRAVSSAHQHGPARLQVNSVPHREQARRREAGFPTYLSSSELELSPPSSCPVHAERRYIAEQYTRSDNFKEIRWPAIRKPRLSRSIASDWARAAARRAI